MVDGANGQIEIGGKNIALQSDAISDFPAILLGQRDIHQSSRPIALPGFRLIRGNDLVGSYGQIFIGISRQLREEVLRSVIFIAASEPRHRSDCSYARNGPNL